MKLKHIYNGDCLEILKTFSDKSVDLILTDPPYGVTANKKDVVVDLDELFRVSKGVILTTQQPYTTEVIYKYRKCFRYDIIWDKILVSGFLNANRMPLRKHEIILVFGDVSYFPQKTKGVDKIHSKGVQKENKQRNYGKHKSIDNRDKLGTLKHPTSIIQFQKPHPSKAEHPTQKPVELFELLVKSYSKENDIILDPFLGSGTTAVACKQLNRNYIGIEISEKYCEIARRRLEQEQLF